MVCIYCGEKTDTTNSRKSNKAPEVWRRRQCKDCGAVFTTYERPDLELALRVKSSEGLKPFLSEKLFLDVYDSLSHRKTAYADAGTLSVTIVSNLLPCKTGVITTNEITEASLKVLKRFDKAAATYYAAHHK